MASDQGNAHQFRNGTQRDDPGHNCGVTDFARVFHTTDVTPVRRCQRDLGISLSEWRQRLRVVTTLPRLEASDKVESVALDLGYGSASAFIVMFRRLMKVTPDECRRSVAAAPLGGSHRQRSGIGFGP